MKSLVNVRQEFSEIKDQLQNSKNRILDLKLIEKLEKAIPNKRKDTIVLDGYHQHQEVTIQQTARQLYQSQKSSRQPILLIGAGASIESGGPSGFRLMEKVIQENIPAHSIWKKAFEHFSLSTISDQEINKIKHSKKTTYALRSLEKTHGNSEEQTANVIRYLYNKIAATKSPQQVYGLFEDFLQYHKPSIGYSSFAELCKGRYFNWIISTNFDPLIEESLFNAGVPNYDVILFSRKVTDPDFLAKFIKNDFSIPPINVFKIHGDLRTRIVDAFSESIQSFSGREKNLRNSLTHLLRHRDLLVAGHSLQDEALNNLIIQSYIDNIKEGNGELNTITLLTPNKDTLKNNNLSNLMLRCLDLAHIAMHRGRIGYIEQSYPHTKINANLDNQVTFDDVMFNLDQEIIQIKNEKEGKNRRRVYDYRKIYHVIGLNPNKHQLMHLAIAPSHIDQNTEPHQLGNTILDKNSVVSFANQIAPIYFSGARDSGCYRVIQSGLESRRMKREIQQISSDAPFIASLFIRFVYLSIKNTVKNIDFSGLKKPKVKGIRALSSYLKQITESYSERLKVFISKKINPDTKEFFKLQRYSSVGDIQLDEDVISACKSIFLLSGSPDQFELTDNESLSDMILSLEKPAENNIIEIPLFRFIPILSRNMVLSDLLNIYSKKNRISSEDNDKLFVTTGGPEHNKILELMIALHRWSGGAIVFNNANEFDHDALSDSQSGLLLATEDFVSGVVKRVDQGETKNTKERREGFGAFIAYFYVPSGSIDRLLYGDKQRIHINKKAIKIIAIIGLSAPGTILGTAYVMFSNELTIKDEGALLVEVPKPPNFNDFKLNTANMDEKKFVSDYLKYILSVSNDIESVEKASKDTLHALMQPVTPAFYDWMRDRKQEKLVDISSNEMHASLWAKIVDIYLKRTV